MTGNKNGNTQGVYREKWKQHTVLEVYEGPRVGKDEVSFR